jgi:hypothetical protein
MISVIISPVVRTNSQSAGNVMNAYELARTFESPRGLMVSSLPGFSGTSPSTKNADIMRTKCGQKCEFKFLNCYTDVTYNFNAVKCPHFDPPLNLTRNPNLNRPGKAAASWAGGLSYGLKQKLTISDRLCQGYTIQISAPTYVTQVSPDLSGPPLRRLGQCMLSSVLQNEKK